MKGDLVLKGTMTMLIGIACITQATAESARVTGEVIDSACYIKMGARGADHAKCAAACSKAGIPLAILTDDGKVLWVSSDKDMENPNEMLEPYVGRKVTLEGEWFERGGTRLFAIKKVIKP